MATGLIINLPKPSVKRRGKMQFSESPTWKTLGGDWRQLHGNLRELGYSLEWHDFEIENDFEWSRSFHPESVEICLNLSGTAEVQAGNRKLELGPSTVGFYGQKDGSLTAIRRGGERHRFITVELSLKFLAEHSMMEEGGLRSDMEKLFESGKSMVSDVRRLTSEQQQLILSLRKPPVSAAALRLWYQAKALEIAAVFLYEAKPKEELFCQRQQRLNRERTQDVIAILKRNLAEPPTLEEMGREVGCSHFHLSRIFTQEMGKTISAYLRDLRMDRAAELLRSGEFNVTEAALEVGYNSLSHFSATFHERFGCCPGLYPLATPAQRNVKRVP